MAQPPEAFGEEVDDRPSSAPPAGEIKVIAESDADLKIAKTSPTSSQLPGQRSRQSGDNPTPPQQLYTAFVIEFWAASPRSRSGTRGYGFDRPRAGRRLRDAGQRLLCLPRRRFRCRRFHPGHELDVPPMFGIRRSARCPDRLDMPGQQPGFEGSGPALHEAVGLTA